MTLMTDCRRPLLLAARAGRLPLVFGMIIFAGPARMVPIHDPLRRSADAPNRGSMNCGSDFGACWRFARRPGEKGC